MRGREGLYGLKIADELKRRTIDRNDEDQRSEVRRLNLVLLS